MQGRIQLPSYGGNMKVILSTHPDTTLQYDQDILDRDPAISAFHPAMLYVARKEGKDRQYEKEPVPNIDMYQQELHIVNKKVTIMNKRSRFDEDRTNISAEDELFSLGDDNCLHIGSNDTNLMLKCLKWTKEVAKMRFP